MTRGMDNGPARKLSFRQTGKRDRLPVLKETSRLRQLLAIALNQVPRAQLGKEAIMALKRAFAEKGGIGSIDGDRRAGPGTDEFRKGDHMVKVAMGQKEADWS